MSLETFSCHILRKGGAEVVMFTVYTFTNYSIFVLHPRFFISEEYSE